MLKSDDEDKSP